MHESFNFLIISELIENLLLFLLPLSKHTIKNDLVVLPTILLPISTSFIPRSSSIASTQLRVWPNNERYVSYFCTTAKTLTPILQTPETRIAGWACGKRCHWQPQRLPVMWPIEHESRNRGRRCRQQPSEHTHTHEKNTPAHTKLSGFGTKARRQCVFILHESLSASVRVCGMAMCTPFHNSNNGPRPSANHDSRSVAARRPRAEPQRAISVALQITTTTTNITITVSHPLTRRRTSHIAQSSSPSSCRR